MGIYFDEEKKIFKLDTENTSYLIGLTGEGYVGHIYYGKKLLRTGGRYLLRTEKSPSVLKREKSSFLDTFPMEYPTCGVGDYRESCLDVMNPMGQTGCEFFYRSHEVIEGKPALKGLPASFGKAGETETLFIHCEDPVLGLWVTLSYSVFMKEDVITRSVKIENKSTSTLVLDKVYSACLDMDNRDFEMVSLAGSWGRERRIQRSALSYGRKNMSSIRGESSHQEHPFMALVTPETTQDQGEAYGMHFVYSGNFMAQAELGQYDQVRAVMGINAWQFSWQLLPSESFQAPEVVLVYSDEGLGKMSRRLHDFYRNHMIRSPYVFKKRPILINNWEATYFNFNTEKLLDIAREAKKSGIEMLVMDDGWFGKRNNDNCSLGDWVVNEEKITTGLKDLVDKVNEIGLEFGIWFEPEMVSPDSDLFREHPDWAIGIVDRERTQSREQYVLDLSRQEVVDYVYECVAKILRSANIAYVKWDMNRQLCDMGSAVLPQNQQGELFHRYVLGVYQLQERLVTEFPELLLENCSGGGARFDPGMIYYSPQIWCSDDTDAMERLRIQEGTALIYPLSCMGAHVSDCPNHVLNRVTPFSTRGNVALAGTFGYELDITKIAEEDREQIPGQVERYHKYNHLVQSGDYYRIASWNSEKPYDCWAVVSKDREEVLVTCVQVLASPNRHSYCMHLKGLDSEKQYCLEETGEIFGGDELMQCGILISGLSGDFQSKLFYFKAVETM
ncbi:MAG: alpha-galactosidase [Lachnospiraceae bacterium]|nr:alpha-galactosidase [Lachnospiraceae bacterium]